jgi:hypothetical protein
VSHGEHPSPRLLIQLQDGKSRHGNGASMNGGAPESCYTVTRTVLQWWKCPRSAPAPRGILFRLEATFTKSNMHF